MASSYSFISKSDVLKTNILLENPLLKPSHLSSIGISTKSTIPLISNHKSSLQAYSDIYHNNRSDSLSCGISLNQNYQLLDNRNSLKVIKDKYSLSFDITPKYAVSSQTNVQSDVKTSICKKSETKPKFIKKKFVEKVSERIKRKSSKIDSEISSKKISKISDDMDFEAMDYTTETYKFSDRKSLDIENGRINPDISTEMECIFPVLQEDKEINLVDDSEEIKLKKELIDVTSSSLLMQCNFKNSEDDVRLELIQLTDIVSAIDPEFILKLALYSRTELNIRTTSNFLMALAAMHLPCRPFISKYFNLAIILPSDWIEVGELYLSLTGEKFMTASLRRAMVGKFPDFDQYQLGKYNKEKSRKKKGKVAVVGEEDEDKQDGKDVSETESVKQKAFIFTIKNLIKKLHISEPVENVMKLLGKRYPSCYDDFFASRLPGVFDETLAGKRMKLPIPETWETQISLRGNKPSVWQDLIDHKKLPYMAMLRNLRNLIQAGISQKHHQIIIKKICDEGAVIHSKQFPFRFFSAYEVLEELEKLYIKFVEENEENISDEITEELPNNFKNKQNLGMRAKIFKATVARGKGYLSRGGRGRGAVKMTGRQQYINIKLKAGKKNWWNMSMNKLLSPVNDEKLKLQMRKTFKSVNNVMVKSPIYFEYFTGECIILSDLWCSMELGGIQKMRQLAGLAALYGYICNYGYPATKMYVCTTEESHSISFGPISKINEEIIRIVKASKVEFKPSDHPIIIHLDSILSRLIKKIKNNTVHKIILLNSGSAEIVEAVLMKLDQYQKKYDVLTNLFDINLIDYAKNVKVLANPQLLNLYRKSLDEAVRIATVHNIQPIRGHTLVLCNISESSLTNVCSSAKGMGTSRSIAEMGILLGLMCKYSCEACQFLIYGQDAIKSIQIENDGILKNVKKVIDEAKDLNKISISNVQDHPMSKYFVKMIAEKQKIDNLIILTPDSDQFSRFIISLLSDYKKDVNPNLLAVEINLSGSKSLYTASDKSIDGLICISGFSDQILRFISEKGENKQLVHINNIDLKYNLNIKVPIKFDQKNLQETIEKPLQVLCPIPKWKTVRVFISSTFLDMHGERDLLTRFIFPELRARMRSRRINIYEVDLRWGLTSEEFDRNSTLELCLSEVEKCDLFIGILGERYGYCPPTYDLPKVDEFAWTNTYPKGASITEMEVEQFLRKGAQVRQNAFFYIRNSNILSDIPVRYLDQFDLESPESKEKLKKLKMKILRSGVETFKDYPCKWGGVPIGGYPMVAGLDEFGKRVIDNLEVAIERIYVAQNDNINEDSKDMLSHLNYFQQLSRKFVGRKNLVTKIFEAAEKHKTGVVIITGKSGCGKTALMSCLVEKYYTETSQKQLIAYSVGCTTNSFSINNLLKFLINQLTNSQIQIEKDSYGELVSKFHNVLSERDENKMPVIVLLDSIEKLEPLQMAHLLTWLPDSLSSNILFFITVTSDSDSYNAISNRSCMVENIVVAGFEAKDRADLVRSTLALYSKKLNETFTNNQMKQIIMKKDASSPFYLNIVCEELRLFGVFEKVGQMISSIPHTLEKLLQDLLSRLELEIGYEIVAGSLTLLYASLDGLTEQELRDLLYIRLNMNDLHDCPSFEEISNVSSLETTIKFSSILMSQLVRELKCLLNPQVVSDDVKSLCIANSEIRQVIKQRYIKANIYKYEIYIHKLLAGYYYMHLSDGIGSFNSSYTKAYKHLPYHLISGYEYEVLEDILTNLKFIQRKLILGLSDNIIKDYQITEPSIKSFTKNWQQLVNNGRLIEYKNFISKHLHIISQSPLLILQQAINEGDDSIVYRDAKKILSESVKSGNSKIVAFIECLNKVQHKDYCIRTIDVPTEPVTCLKLSPDGSTLACGFNNASIKLYNASNYEEQYILHGHGNSITCFCFIGSTKLCSGSADCTLSIWNVLSAYRIAILKGHSRIVSDCSVDTSGKILVSVAWDFAIKLWNANTGDFITNLAVENRPINSVDFHPEGQLICTGSWDGTIKLYHVGERSRKAVFRGHESSVKDAKFNEDGKHITSTSIDGCIKVWSTSYGVEVGSMSNKAAIANQIAYSEGGNQLLTACDNHIIKIWSSNIGRAMGLLGNSLHKQVNCITIANGTLYAGYHEGFVRAYDISSGILEWENNYSTTPIAITGICTFIKREYNYLIVSRMDGVILIIEILTGKIIFSLDGHKPKGSISVTASKLRSVETAFIVSTGDDSNVYVYPIISLKKTKRFLLQSHQGEVKCCSINHDETKLATSGKDRAICLWELPLFFNFNDIISPLMKFEDAHYDWVTCICWSSDSDFLVTGSNDFTIKLWDIKNNIEKRTFSGLDSTITAINYQLGCIVASGANGLVKIWSHKGAEITTLGTKNHRANYCAVDIQFKTESGFSEQSAMDWGSIVEEEEAQLGNKTDKKKKPEQILNILKNKIRSMTVAVCFDDGNINLWRPLETSELTTLTGHSGAVLNITTGKSGLSVSSCEDKTIKFWKYSNESIINESVENIKLNEELDIGRVFLQNHDGEVTCIVLSKCKRFLAIASRSGYITLYNIDSNGLIMSSINQLISESAVLCILFGPEDLMFVGCADGYLSAWQITRQSDHIKIRIISKIEAIGPITDLISIDDILVLYHTIGLREITCFKYKDSVFKFEDSLFKLIQPCLTDSFDTYYKYWRKFLDNKSLCEVPDVYNRKKFVHFKRTLYGCDDNGNIFIANPYFLEKKQKIHNGEIILLKLIDDKNDSLLITASRDHYLKFWKLPQFYQVGQYFCQSPVICIDWVKNDYNSYYVICGSQSGASFWFQCRLY